MRRAFTLVLSLLLVYTVVAAQDVRYGVFNPYSDSPGVETPAPKGYKPFYISHFGRHGSRYLSSEKVVEPALTVLAAAQEEGILTPKGKMLLEKVQELYTRSEGMWGQLSALGTQEHKAIARRMVKRCPVVFSDSVRVMASVYPRCIVSMAASTGEIARLAPKSKWSYTVGKRYQSIINTAHRPQSWVSGASLQKKYLKEHLDEEKLLLCLFSNTARGKELVGNSTSFVKALYFAWAGREAIGLEPFGLEDILGQQAVDVITASDNLAGYRNMAIPNADSLITDIVVKADAAIASGQPQADLRYGHDNGLMRLLVQLGMEGYPVNLDEGEAAAFCFAEKMPLAANLQMVFYRNCKGKVLVKFLINEHERKLTVLPGGPYYAWEDIRALLEKHCLK